MTNAGKYIDLVGKLYNQTPKQMQQMEHNISEIDNELKKYSWEDIKNKTNLFYARKNDKSRPRLSQILALLETDPNVQVVEEEQTIDTVQGYKRPTTKIWAIKSTFNKLVDVLTDGGVLPTEDGEYKNTRSLVDPATDIVILNPRQWLLWHLSDAEATNPDLFAKYPFATWIERLAIAVQNKLVVFKTRDWAKLTQKSVVDARNKVEWHNYTTKVITANQGA